MPAATLDRHNHDDYDDCGDDDDDDDAYIKTAGFPSPLKPEIILDFLQKLGLRMWKLSSLHFI